MEMGIDGDVLHGSDALGCFKRPNLWLDACDTPWFVEQNVWFELRRGCFLEGLSVPEKTCLQSTGLSLSLLSRFEVSLPLGLLWLS